ncbi:hydrogenase maturation nickel metallochaperone HypA [Eggerthella sinensis]|uniref:hydrogenase maturation nickel metallochaperone HypA/HybF n=1 Tax=Eggerthella sinensis TaxID=242230 RepID=UPI0022E4104B|nr:hydrogenase maturation nickel metallochaperone HypA [Eggerthella sinensis]
MHEMALTRDVVDIVLEEAEAAGATEVRAVYLTIGYVRDIVEDLFEQCFAYMARGTIAEHAELVLTRVPLTVRCNACGRVFHLDVHDNSTWVCAACGERSYQLETGMEFFVNGLEVKKEDAHE